MMMPGSVHQYGETMAGQIQTNTVLYGHRQHETHLGIFSHLSLLKSVTDTDMNGLAMPSEATGRKPAQFKYIDFHAIISVSMVKMSCMACLYQ